MIRGVTPEGLVLRPQAQIVEGEHTRQSTGQRHFCGKCGTALWLWDPTWPELVHPHAGAIDTPLPTPPANVHILLDSKAAWVAALSEMAATDKARAVLGTKIVSAWGMTENGAVTLIELNDPDERAFTTDGHPLPGVELKVIDFDGSSLPPGEAGKLMVRSVSNFGGYLKRPQWNGTDADGWFDTGDLARMDSEGYIRITGRSKDVIIRGGENVYPAEVESALMSHPAIADVAVIGVPHEKWGETVKAIVVKKADVAVTEAEIIEFSKGLLARFKCPTSVDWIDALPRNPSGKILKKDLRAPYWEGRERMVN